MSAFGYVPDSWVAGVLEETPNRGYSRKWWMPAGERKPSGKDRAKVKKARKQKHRRKP